MLNAPTVLAVTATPLKEALEGYGVDFTALAHRAGIDPAVLSTPNARLPSTGVQRLWELAATASGDPLFGFRVGAFMRPGVFHALGLGIVSSTSVRSALERVERCSSVVSTNGRFVLLEGDGEVGLETQPHEMTVMPTTHCVDAVVVGLCRLLAHCAGPMAVPSRVVLMRPRTAPPETYRAYLRCPIQFDGRHIAIMFNAETANRPVLTGNEELAAEADRLSRRYLDELAPDPTVARVRALLLRVIPAGEFDQPGVARQLNQSTSTLQRHLRRAGTNYQDLLDATRRDLSLEYLKEGRYSLADIAFLLGFADQANFTRAFKRWTGKPPSAYLT